MQSKCVEALSSHSARRCPTLQGVFSTRLEKYLVEMYLKEKALFWGAAAAEQLMAQQEAAKEMGNTGKPIFGIILAVPHTVQGCSCY